VPSRLIQRTHVEWLNLYANFTENPALTALHVRYLKFLAHLTVTEYISAIFSFRLTVKALSPGLYLLFNYGKQNKTKGNDYNTEKDVR